MLNRNLIGMESPALKASLPNADALILLTEWTEFRSPDFNHIKTQLKQPLIFDGRNLYHRLNLEAMGFIYEQIGVNRLPLSVFSNKPKTEN